MIYSNTTTHNIVCSRLANGSPTSSPDTFAAPGAMIIIIIIIEIIIIIIRNRSI